jgi:hypothetical protein
MKWKICERKWSWPNLKLYPYILPHGLSIIGDSAEIETGHLLDSGRKAYRLRQLPRSHLGAHTALPPFQLPLKSFDVLAALVEAHFYPLLSQ